VNRRERDVIAVYANTEIANTVLGWETKLTLEDALASAWYWGKRFKKVIC
jgi:UDP-glucose 4-epimerase